MKPKVAFFDFSGCEGCQLDALNLDAGDVVDLLNAVDIVNFREVMTERADDYDIAFIEGSVTRESEIARLQKIRSQAKVLVALGACASIGGVNCLKNHLPMEEALRIVYGDKAGYYDTIPARPANAVVAVDYYVRGCPPVTGELVKVVKALLLGKKPEIPNFPVCVECKMAGNICVFERGKTCLGPVIRAGCSAICVTSGRHCWGCRGLVDEPNVDSEKDILQKYGLTVAQVVEKFKIYNTYGDVAK
ncbi:MAG: NADH:ubiquinone oxidoreductase [Chloroflexota bacterium]|nr:NADH:ubiquinone oxidoreductase [Chloroflexota bacterium]